MFTDFVLNGEGNGPLGALMQEMRWEPGLLRPFIETNPNSPLRGRPCVTINTGRRRWDDKLKMEVPVYKTVSIRALQERGINSPVFNATSLRKEEWIKIDAMVQRAVRPRLRLVADLMERVPYGGFDGMANMTLEYEAMSDPGEANVDMDGLTEGRNDMPLFSLRSMPLPIIHADFSLSERKLASSRKGNTPLDSVLGEAGGRRVGEVCEALAIGTSTGPTYGTVSTGPTAHTGTSTVYGLINFPYRITSVTLTAPTGSNPEVILGKVLDMRQAMFDHNFFGPFMLYHSTDWDRYLDDDYARLGGSNANMTLRDRIRAIEGIEDCRRLDFLTPALSHAFTMVLVSMNSETIQMVDGLGLTTLQWDTVAGMRKNFKIMTIKATRPRYDYNGNCGIVHATT